MSLEQQRDILDHTHKLLTDFNFGKPPKGYVAPWWETSKEGTALLSKKGIEYGWINILVCVNWFLIPSLMHQITPICATSELSRLAACPQDLNCPSSQAYYLRDEDRWTKIDYAAKAKTWMKPLTRGNETGIVEIPANWCVSPFRIVIVLIVHHRYLDDMQPMM